MDDRLQRDVEDLAVRIRTLEALDTPFTRQLVKQVADLQEAVSRINERGAVATIGELRRLADRIAALREDVADVERSIQALRDEGKALRRAVLIAVLAAALSLAGSLILRALGP